MLKAHSWVGLHSLCLDFSEVFFFEDYLLFLDSFLEDNSVAAKSERPERGETSKKEQHIFIEGAADF